MQPSGTDYVNFGALVTIAIFVAGVIYHSGRLAQRVDNLERFAERYEKHFDALFEEIREVRRLLSGGTPR